VPPIIKTVAIEDRGTEELAETIQRTYEQFQTGEQRLQKLRAAARQRLLGLLQERLVRKAVDTAFPNDAMDRIVDQIARRESDPYSIVENLVRRARFEA